MRINTNTKIYKNISVFDAALERIRFIFDEFPNVICNVSGGKDSDVVFNLCLRVAREKGRLPLKVLFIDQEAEYEHVINHIRDDIMSHPDVEPKWYQMPMVIFNATSTTEHWLKCWDPDCKDRWMREKEEISIKENIYGTVRFAELFSKILEVEYGDIKTAYIAGVTAAESPARHVGLTYGVTYKWVTWGKTLNKRRQHYTFYPLYDWTVTDAWKAIHSNGWRYSKIYELMFQYGIPLSRMRVSNLHHETAVWSLFTLQELEPKTYEKLTRRLAGVDMAGKMNVDNYFVRELPFMFSSWKEYRDYLLEKLIDNEDWRSRLSEAFRSLEYYVLPEERDKIHKIQIQCILTNDWELEKLGTYAVKIRRESKKRRGGYDDY